MDNRKFIQNINGVVNGNVNMAGRDINYNKESTDKIQELLLEIKKFIEENHLEKVVGAEEKENVIDDIQTLEEQCNREKASGVKVRKALNGIVAFVKKIPSTVAGATMLITQTTELQESVQKLLENIPKA